jgi:hypothetical protein
MKLVAFFVALAVLSSISYAHTVTTNFAFNIGGNKDDTIIHVNNENYPATYPNELNFSEPEKKYISAQRNGLLVYMIFNGNDFLNIKFRQFDTDNYMFQMIQDADKNKFIIGFTRGNWSDIENKLSGIPSKTIGNLQQDIKKDMSFFVRTDYSGIDLLNTLRVSGIKKLVVKNTGIYDRRQGIEIKVVS